MIIGWGIYALKSFEPHVVVFKSTPLAEYSTRTSHTIQKSLHKHIYMDLPGRFINHSCDANVGIVDNDEGAYDFVAVKPIKTDEELTWVSPALCVFHSPNNIKF